MSFMFSTRGLMATIATAATFAAAPVSAQTIVQPYNDALNYGFGNAGANFTPTFGQSFLAAGSVLNSFTFWLSNENFDNTPNADQLLFQGYVAQWDDGTGVVGPLLFSSTVQSGPTALSQAFTFNTGALAVTNGASYIAFLTVPDLGALVSSAGFEQSNSNSSGGQMFFSLNNDVSTIVSGGRAEWIDGAGVQTHFEASFSASETTVPEPATGFLMGAGLLGLVVAARRRRA